MEDCTHLSGIEYCGINLKRTPVVHRQYEDIIDAWFLLKPFFMSLYDAVDRNRDR